MQSKLNLIVTIESKEHISPVKQIGLIDDFITKHKDGFVFNGVILKFDLANIPFCLED
jgi:hypothetical protein